jgi:hypothetical protein
VQNVYYYGKRRNNFARTLPRKIMKFTRNDLTLALIALLGSLSLVDVTTTTLILQRGGRELNEFLIPIVQDPALFMTVKFLAMFAIVGLAVGCRMVTRRGEHAVLATSVMMNLSVALWNTAVLWRGGCL